MRSLRWVPPSVVLLTTVALVVVGEAVPAPEAATDRPTVQTEPVTGAQRLCPSPLDLPDVDTTVAAVALPDPALDEADLPAEGRLDLLPLVEGDAEPLASQGTRSVTAASRTDQPVLLRADGAMAPGVTGQSTVTAAAERTAGLAAAACVEPAKEWWFVGGSGQVGERATLVLANVAEGPAVVDVDVWADGALVSGAGTTDLGVPASGSRTLSVDAVGRDSQRLAVRVRADAGRVGAALALREVDGADPVGLSWVAPSLPPSELTYLPAADASGTRSVRLLNPGDVDGVVTLRVLTEEGPFIPTDLDEVDVPAGHVVDVDLADATDGVFSVEVAASVPVVASVRVASALRNGLGDFAVQGSTAPLDEPAAAMAVRRNKRSSRLLLAGLPTAADQTGAEPGPAETTTVQIALLDKDGAEVGSSSVTVAAGSTVSVPVTPPKGTGAAWVVVEPEKPEAVLASLETTATVQVPDPLDSDRIRRSLWLDVVPLVSVLSTVEVPPVLPDITAGLPR